MVLVEQIRALESRTLVALDEGLDYYANTKSAWRYLQKSLHKERGLAVFTSGAASTSQELLKLSQHYIAEYLRPLTFQHFVSLFEIWFFDFLGLWLAEYPQSLAKKSLDFGLVLQSPNMDAVTLVVIERELNELRYKRPADWFSYLDKLVHLGTPASVEIERLAEIKASRDVLVHNKGLVNAVYVSKSGGQARYRVGDKLKISVQYHRQTWETIRRVVADVSDAACSRLTTPGL